MRSTEKRALPVLLRVFDNALFIGGDEDEAGTTGCQTWTVRYQVKDAAGDFVKLIMVRLMSCLTFSGRRAVCASIFVIGACFFLVCYNGA